MTTNTQVVAGPLGLLGYRQQLGGHSSERQRGSAAAARRNDRSTGDVDNHAIQTLAKPNPELLQILSKKLPKEEGLRKL